MNVVAEDLDLVFVVSLEVWCFGGESRFVFEVCFVPGVEGWEGPVRFEVWEVCDVACCFVPDGHLCDDVVGSLVGELVAGGFALDPPFDLGGSLSVSGDEVLESRGTANGSESSILDPKGEGRVIVWCGVSKYGSVSCVAGASPYTFVCNDNKGGVVLGEVGKFEGGGLSVGGGGLDVDVVHAVGVGSRSSSGAASCVRGDQ